jgi:hypothetical protein
MSIFTVTLKSLNTDKEESKATLTSTILHLFVVKRRSQRIIFSALWGRKPAEVLNPIKNENKDKKVISKKN